MYFYRLLITILRCVYRGLPQSNQDVNLNSKTTIIVSSRSGSSTQAKSDAIVQNSKFSRSFTQSELDPKANSEIKLSAISTPTPLFPLLIRNLGRNVTIKLLQKMFKKWKSVQYVWIFKSEFENRDTDRAVVLFRDDGERADAIQEFQISWTCAAQTGNTMYWAVLPSSLYDQGVLENTPLWKFDPKPRNLYTSRQPDNEYDRQTRYWGRHSDDSIEPGLILMLPKYEERRPEFYIDPRIEKPAYGHPVIVVQDFGDGFWNVVICTSKPPDRGWPTDDATRHRYMEIEWPDYTREEETLKLARGRRHMFVKSYAGTTSYTVEINALVRLWNSTNRPYDYKIASLDLLKSRIKDVDCLYEPGDARGHPGYFGGRVDKTYTPRVGIGFRGTLTLDTKSLQLTGLETTDIEAIAKREVEQPLKVTSKLTPLLTYSRSGGDHFL